MQCLVAFAIDPACCTYTPCFSFHYRSNVSSGFSPSSQHQVILAFIIQNVKVSSDVDYVLTNMQLSCLFINVQDNTYVKHREIHIIKG